VVIETRPATTQGAAQYREAGLEARPCGWRGFTGNWLQNQETGHWFGRSSALACGWKAAQSKQAAGQAQSVCGHRKVAKNKCHFFFPALKSPEKDLANKKTLSNSTVLLCFGGKKTLCFNKQTLPDP